MALPLHCGEPASPSLKRLLLMALLSRVYFNAVFGALGGLLGWLLFGVFGEKNPGEQAAILFLTEVSLNALVGGALIGGLIGYFVVSVDAIRDQSLIRFARLASYGVCLGAVGGAVGMYVGDLVNYYLQSAFGGVKVVGPIMALFARGLGWSLLGVAIGASEGIASRSMGKFSYGTIGGFLGGFIGGVIVQLFYDMAKASLSSTHFWGALGLVILGACIGALSALVQAVFQPASVKVMRGWQEGREYPLDKPSNLLGRMEHADIALFRDMKVEKKHAYIRREGENYVLVNNGAPAGDTLVNETPVPTTRPLADGDRIQLGNVILRFQARAAVNRKLKPARR